MVRNERAVRPCLPITRPKSPAATRSLNAAPPASSVVSTVTSSGLSTKDFAICSINAVIWSGRDWRSRGSRNLQQPAHGIGGLRPLADPVVDAFLLQFHRGRFSERIVVTHDLHRLAVRCLFFFHHHHAIARFLLGSDSRQTNYQHSV